LPSKRPPPHEKQTILDGYEDGSYSATLKKRRDERAVFLALNESRGAAVDCLPLFGPSTKKLKQTTLTQDFNEFPGLESQVIDLTHKPPPSSDGGKRKAVIDLSRNLVVDSPFRTPS
jgi:hypothetical protein